MTDKLTNKDILDILDKIKYKNWELRSVLGEELWIQWRFLSCDNYSERIAPAPELQSCRKWKLSRWMTPSEIVRTAYLAVIQAETHETAENFKLMGTAIYDPHVDLFALSEALVEGTVGQDYR